VLETIEESGRASAPDRYIPLRAAHPFMIHSVRIAQLKEWLNEIERVIAGFVANP